MPLGTLQVAESGLTTYVLQAAVDGPSGGGPSGSNKAMASILNPSGSGVIVKVRSYIVAPESSSGTNVIVLHELRSITAHSGGTNFTPLKRDSDSVASAIEAKTEPASVTGTTNVQSLIYQSNTAQDIYKITFGTDGDTPIVLREGEGIVIHQVTSNGGTNQLTLVWTEE